MLDRRKDRRWPAYLKGTISFAKHFAVADCLVRNTSERGAKLVIFNGNFVPDEFDLSIPHKQVAVRARARWRRMDQMGVEFPPQHPADAPVPLQYVRRVKRLEAENERLRKRLQDE